MTTTAATASVPNPGWWRNALGRRQLHHYPDTLPRLGYLAIVVLTTIMLYYLYYVEGAVTPLLLPYYHMSFQYFLYLLVVSNAIGAFSAFIGGLSDKIGRANLTIYGTLVVAIIQLFAIPHISEKFWFAACYCVIGFVEGVILVSTPALMRDFSPQMGRGVAMGFWALGPTMGALCASLVATHTLTHLAPWQDQFIISGLVCLGVVVVAFFFLRELSPQLRNQLMVSERERALIEARAMGIDVEKTTAHPIRSMMKLDLIASSIGHLAVPPVLFRLGQRPHHLLGGDVQPHRLTGERHQRLAGGLPLRRPGRRRRALGLGSGAQALHALRRPLRHRHDGVPDHPDGPPAHRVLLQRPGDRAARRVSIAMAYAPWMANYTEQVESHNPALTASGLAMWGWILRITVALSFLVLPYVITTSTVLVDNQNAGSTLQAIQAAQPYTPNTSALKCNATPAPANVIADLRTTPQARPDLDTLATILAVCNRPTA